MLVSINRGLCFVCMPKCASTSLEAALEPFCEIILKKNPTIKHMTVADYYEKVAPIVEVVGSRKITTFSLFREPMEWLFSWYRYRAREELANPNHVNHKNYTGDISFNDFLMSYVSDGEVSFPRRKRQVDFVMTPKGIVGVDKIFRYERMDLLKDFLEKKVGKSLNIPKKNISPSGVEMNVDPKIMKMAEEYLKPEYEIYNCLK
ncbi:sulfotransferase family 2 domain-containing protein [Halomonas korlensis]|uniref:Sulfotransferase family protein n=1 Tax=Halomonas korlensis TaxID=463301 RepID=A0A1I7J4G0_9GAMM|nr:sulfotransferase family 2 domain-containing protein [Halomonas korlensis]SFU80089.1 Sulfotransferase family protein [Halomonas korlensis]